MSKPRSSTFTYNIDTDNDPIEKIVMVTMNEKVTTALPTSPNKKKTPAKHPEPAPAPQVLEHDHTHRRLLHHSQSTPMLKGAWTNCRLENAVPPLVHGKEKPGRCGRARIIICRK